MENKINLLHRSHIKNKNINQFEGLEIKSYILNILQADILKFLALAPLSQLPFSNGQDAFIDGPL